jgi:DNA repair exonuclease SbcCD ATPase subunit
MRITALTLRDFMGYEEANLDLGSVASTVVVGDNGSGKSTLLDAITWCLYDRISRDVASQDALIRDGADQTVVVVSFTSGSGHDVSVMREKARGRTGTLTLAIDDQPRTAHTQAETRTVIAGLVGLSYDALMAGPVMAQETAGAFMHARPAERKDLLVHLFGLDEFAPLHTLAKERATDHAAKVTAAEMMVGSASDVLVREPTVRFELEVADVQLGTLMEAQSLASDRIIVHRATLAATEGLMAKNAAITARHADLVDRKRREGVAVERLTAAIADTEAKIVAASAPIYDLPPSDEDRVLAEWEVALTTAADARESLARLTGDLAATRDAYARMERARAYVADVPCGAGPAFASCRFLAEVPSEIAMTKMLALGMTQRDEANTAGFLAAPYEDLRAKVVAARTAVSRRFVMEAQIVERRQGQSGLVVALEQARASSKAALASSAQNLSALEADIAAAEAERTEVLAAVAARGEAAEALADAEEAYRQHREAANAAGAVVAGHRAGLVAIEKAKADHEEWSALLAEHGNKRDVYRLLAEAFHRDGIPSLILAEGIPAIEEEANAVLEGLPGGLTLALRTQREKKGGGMADTLDVVVTANGWEREYGMLSVGQRFRVDLALRLGLSRVLTRRGGGRVETLWLDEPLAALDASGREAVMETLGALSVDFGLLVVVSHHPDFNDRFPGRIEVTMEDGVSNAVLVA